MNVYREAKGEFCQLMAESEEDLRETAAKIGLNAEETEDYVEKMLELFRNLNIALMRLCALTMIDEPAKLDQWTDACDRLEREFIGTSRP